MALTEIDICNLALARVKAGEIGDLNEQSREAEKCRIFYPQSRDYVLSSFAWNFAKKTRVLSTSLEESVEYPYTFDHPNDCLVARYLIQLDEDGSALQGRGVVDVEPPEFEVMLDSNDKKIICTHIQYAALVYTKNITDTTLWGALVDELIAWRLAQDISIPLAGDSGKKYRNDAVNAYMELASQAMAKTANEAWPRKKRHMPNSIKARGQGPLSRDEYLARRGY